MRFWKRLSRANRSAGVSRAGAIEVERIESRCRDAARLPVLLPVPLGEPAIVESLEHRLHLTGTFDCYMSAAVVNRTVSIVLWTTGGQASQYVVYWNDTNSGGSISTTYTAPANGTPLPESYTYHGTGTFSPTVTTVATLSGSSTTATAYYALNKSFGNFQAQGTGASTYVPNGDVNSVGQTSMAIDPVSTDHFYKEVFVAHSYYPSGGGGPLFGITAFSGGQFDSSWGTYNGAANNGTLVVPSFGGGSDVPYAIAYDPNGTTPLLIVVGKCATGWAIAVVNMSLDTGGTGQYGNAQKTSASNFEAGQANAVWADQTDGGGHFVAVGTNNTKMVAVGENSADLSVYSSWPTPSGIVTIPYTGSQATQASANSVVEVDDVLGIHTGEELIIGGYTSFCCSGFPFSSDFTLVDLQDSDGTAGSLGSIRTNIGQTLHHDGHSVTNNPSTDSAYSVVPWQDSTGVQYFTAVGQSNALGAQRFTMAQYTKDTNGHFALYSSFGQYGDGIATGPAGAAHGAVLDSLTNGTFEVVGAANGDFLTAKFTALGALDTTFGNGGLMYQDFGDTAGNNSGDTGYSVEIGIDGSILVCGNTLPNGPQFQRIALVDILDGNTLTVN